jgi:hypothetical protein
VGKACVESGDMTHDLVILIRADHPWPTTNQFLDKLDGNLPPRTRAHTDACLRASPAID